jgi:hypothetical protein
VSTGPTLVFLYGPPAVGKLTVARALAELTGFRVLHNHLLADHVAEVLDWGTPRYWSAVGEMRGTLLRAAASESIDLIFTYVFAPVDASVVETFCGAFEEAGGRVACVRLVASRDELKRRVTGESRREWGKPVDPALLDEILRRYHLFHALPHRRSLTIDTGALSAEAAAEQIVEELGLPRL